MRVLPIIFFLVTLVAVLFPVPTQAQALGSDPNNYFCPPFGEVQPESEVPNENFKCTYRFDNQTVTRQALLKPPPLDIAQIWFVRILYIIWGTAGIVFSLILVGIGFRYMTSGGNEIVMGEVIKSFQKWVIGLVLVFFSYPILATFFDLLPIKDNQCYSEIQLPAFQFFFASGCVACDQRCERQLPSMSGYIDCLVQCRANE